MTTPKNTPTESVAHQGTYERHERRHTFSSLDREPTEYDQLEYRLWGIVNDCGDLKGMSQAWPNERWPKDVCFNAAMALLNAHIGMNYLAKGEFGLATVAANQGEFFMSFVPTHDVIWGKQDEGGESDA